MPNFVETLFKMWECANSKSNEIGNAERKVAEFMEVTVIGV
jgi:hypothetical protein